MAFSKFLDPKNDVAFRRIFGTEKNKDILIHFLNDILGFTGKNQSQRIQTDRGQEFFAYEVQECLKEWKIKFRPIKPFSPHLNGKVERAQRTDLDEFYSSVNIKDYELQVKLRDWEEYYNKQRPHSSLQGKTPWEKYKELEKIIPCLSEIQKNYISSKETFVMQNYKHNQELKSLQKYKTS